MREGDPPVVEERGPVVRPSPSRNPSCAPVSVGRKRLPLVGDLCCPATGTDHALYHVESVWASALSIAKAEATPCEGEEETQEDSASGVDGIVTAEQFPFGHH